MSLYSFWERIVHGEKFFLVKTEIYDLKRGHEKGNIFLHFYESSSGKRKFDMATTFQDQDEKDVWKFVKSTKTYNNRILRWLSGRYDPEIPRYRDISEEDTANALRGKIE